MSDVFSNIPFNRAEFACRCGCGFDTVDAELLELAVIIRLFEGEAVTINSGCRCHYHNSIIGGMMGSKHLEGRAADFSVKNPLKTYEFLCDKYPHKYGLGVYDTFIHVDSRSDKARWKA